MSHFVSILSVGNIFLAGGPQVLSLLNVTFKSIFKPHKSLIQKRKILIYIYIYVCVCVCVCVMYAWNGCLCEKALI